MVGKPPQKKGDPPGRPFLESARLVLGLVHPSPFHFRQGTLFVTLKLSLALTLAAWTLGTTAFAQAPPNPPAPAPAPVPVPAPPSPPIPVVPAPAAPTLPNAGAITVPPPSLPPAYVPFKQIAAPPLDEAHNGIGLAQQTARARGAQGRVLWIDGTANLDRVNSVEKITALMTQIKTAGFNTVVFDIKPIVGLTLYPSKIAPKITAWKGRTLPIAFDPLAAMVTQAHANNLQLVVNMCVFSEGHRDFRLGPGYAHPEWQTTLYESTLQVVAGTTTGPAFALSDRANLSARVPEQLAVYTDLTKLGRLPPGTLVAILDATRRVVALMDGGALGALSPTLPPNGSALVGAGLAAAYLKQNAAVGSQISLATSPVFVPITERPEQQVPLMTNPNSPDVQNRMLGIVGEVTRNYAIDGVIFDDRLRYAGLNADFSPLTRAQFEKYLGRPVKWPDDVFRFDVAFPSLTRRVVPGPAYDSWLLFRALTIRNWLASAIATVKSVRPTATVAVYAGSWYPDYPALGSNWAADDFSAGLRFLTPAYQQTGFAGLLDWLTTGCYYTAGSIAEAAASGRSSGESVEAAGQFSNRAANDRTWVYAGLSLDHYDKHPEQLKSALQAAAASTQGVMVFDLSHNIDQFWPVFQSAFASPAPAPHAVPGLLDDVRKQHDARKAAGTPDPPVILLSGTPGTGL